MVIIKKDNYTDKNIGISSKNIILKQHGDYNSNFKTLYIDIDDCLLKTSEAIISILQRKFQNLQNDRPDFCNWSMEECLKHLTKWNYSNFVENRLTRKELVDIFDSEEFWEKVEIDDDFLYMVNDYSVFYNIVFISKGQKKNLERKEKMLNDLYECGDLKIKVGFIGIKSGTPKSIIDMSNGIQIDDNYRYLEDTNAKLKILYRNKYCNDSDYNGVQVINGNLDNLYVAEFVDEIEQILRFDSSYLNDKI